MAQPTEHHMVKKNRKVAKLEQNHSPIIKHAETILQYEYTNQKDTQYPPPVEQGVFNTINYE